jgi:hypothetical protein
LLKQLANATTAAQIQSLTAQIHDAEASISSDEATLRALNNQIDFSKVRCRRAGSARAARSARVVGGRGAPPPSARAGARRDLTPARDRVVPVNAR